MEIYRWGCRCTYPFAGLAAVGRGGRRHTPVFVLPREGGGRLLGTVRGAAMSPPW
jgi:hypothetical protein